jgi:membrane peptidoglycan carboxypeptidase
VVPAAADGADAALEQAAAPVPSRAARRRRRGRRVFRAVLLVVLAGVLGAGAFVWGLLSAPASFALPPAPRPAVLLAADGATEVGAVLPAERREPVPAGQIPQVVRDAVISAEDERFLDHKGVDPISTLRAAYRDLTGGVTQGGSTLTQQYVKNAYVGDDRTLVRKLREAALAVRLEQRLDKQEILTDYLNAFYLGNGTYGVQAAARFYFGVPVQDLALDPATGRRSPVLELARAAMLAGIAPAPSAWNPVADLATAKARQQYTLNRMVVGGYLSTAQASDAYSQPLVLARATPPDPPSAAPEFTDLLSAQLRQVYAASQRDDQLFRAGLKVTSTLDAALQAALTRAAAEVLPGAQDPQLAAVAIDPATGDVKALTTLRRVPARTLPDGSSRPASAGYARGGFDLATGAYRSAGSTIKPFTLAVALQEGHTLDERRPAPACDALRDPASPGGLYRYCNAGDSGGGGTVTLRTALARSLNTVFVPLALEVGRDRVRQLLLDAGAKVPAPTAAAPDPFSTAPASFGLGTTAEVTPLSLANAYATLLDHGVRRPPRFYTAIRTAGSAADPGRLVAQAPEVPAGTPVLDAGVADQVVEAMSRVATPQGTAPAAAQPFPVFGKTGTTNDSTNAWFVGCSRTPSLCLAVWMGYEDQSCTGVQGRCGGMTDVEGVREVYGGTLPAKVYARTFALLRAGG